MVDNPLNNFDRQVMLKLLKEMMLDSSQYSWPQVRDYYRILASGIEMARYNWSDSAQIANIRAQYAQRPIINYSSNQSRFSHTRSANFNDNVRVCFNYQQGECQESDTHNSYLHICAFCLCSTGMMVKHPERDCRRKSYSKNVQRGE